MPGRPVPIPIDDPDDARIAAYRAVRERDLVGRQGRFVAEGRVVVDVLLSAGRFEAESLLILDRRLEGMGPTLRRAPPGLPVYVAAQAVMDAIAGFHVHRGVLAVGLRGEPPEAEALLAALPRRAVVVAPVGISNHDNMGAIFRNAAAFGADTVLIDGTCCDPLYRKAIRVSVGAALKVPFAVAKDASAMLELVLNHGFVPMALSPRGTQPVSAIEPPGRAALFLGTEGQGLPPSLMEGMRTVRIPMSPAFDSLNVAAATAVALHRLGPWR